MNWMEAWLNRTQDDKAAIKKLLTRLSKSKNKSFLELANNTHDEVFDEIDCLECANCCKSIPPIINELDVKRAAKFLGMKVSDFKNQYIRIDEDLDMVMKSSPCPFLEEDNKCFIYEGRPRACREYPHTDNYKFLKNIKLHKKNSEYCPAVYHMLLRMNKHI